MFPNPRNTPRPDYPEPHEPQPRTSMQAQRTQGPRESNPDRPSQELTIGLDDHAVTGRERLPILMRFRQRSIWRTVRSAPLIAAAAVALFATNALPTKHDARPPLSSAQQETAHMPTSPMQPQSHEERVRLITPGTATQGQQLIVLGHRNSGLCGPAELRFDGNPVRHRILAYAGDHDDTYQQLFMSMDVPRSAAPGTHRIELFGPVRSTRGSICGDVPEHQARIDTATISINAAPQDETGPRVRGK
jgi:hypothetical protein